MLEDHNVAQETGFQAAPGCTLREILQQPTLWPLTAANVCSAAKRLQLPDELGKNRVLLTGAGTSAYAASAVAAAWSGAVAVPTTDLLVDTERYLPEVGTVVSLARSGDSPESAAVVQRIRVLQPNILQLAILCNENGALSRSEIDELIVLDPRTNDQSLVMTGSFSNLVLAGLAMAQSDAVDAAVNEFSKRAAKLLPEIDAVCRRASTSVRDRIVILSSSPLLGWAREAGLKVLEMTAGRFPVTIETYLGLRHGPMSFLRPDTLVLCLLSSDPVRRLYEVDLLHELRSKRIGRLIGIADPVETKDLFDEIIPAVAPLEDDALRTPYEILGPQLFGYYLSLRSGLNPDRPSPDGVINRVVQGVKIHGAPFVPVPSPQ